MKLLTWIQSIMYPKEKLYYKYRTLLTRNNINSTLRLSHFFGQMKHESGLKPIAENLNYSVEALLKVFGRHRITVEQANKYGRKPGQNADQETLANILYGGTWGKRNLGNTQYGDGWKYRGRGFKQITGRYNYERLSKDTGIDYIGNPDLLLNEADAMISAIWFWNSRDLNSLADKDDGLAITIKINGGTNGLRERLRYTEEFKEKFKYI